MMSDREERSLNYRSVIRRLFRMFAILILLYLGWWTVKGGIRNLHQADTIGQRVETPIQLVCGLLCIVVVVTRFWGRHLFQTVRITWVITLVVWVGLSALVWGPPMPLVALLFVVVALLVAWGILWALGPAITT